MSDQDQHPLTPDRNEDYVPLPRRVPAAVQLDLARQGQRELARIYGEDPIQGTVAGRVGSAAGDFGLQALGLANTLAGGGPVYVQGHGEIKDAVSEFVDARLAQRQTERSLARQHQGVSRLQSLLEEGFAQIPGVIASAPLGMPLARGAAAVAPRAVANVATRAATTVPTIAIQGQQELREDPWEFLRQAGVEVLVSGLIPGGTEGIVAKEALRDAVAQPAFAQVLRQRLAPYGINVGSEMGEEGLQTALGSEAFIQALFELANGVPQGQERFLEALQEIGVGSAVGGATAGTLGAGALFDSTENQETRILEENLRRQAEIEAATPSQAPTEQAEPTEALADQLIQELDAQAAIAQREQAIAQRPPPEVPGMDPTMAAILDEAARHAHLQQPGGAVTEPTPDPVGIQESQVGEPQRIDSPEDLEPHAAPQDIPPIPEPPQPGSPAAVDEAIQQQPPATTEAKPAGFQVGDRVRTTRGKKKGQTGIVTEVTPDGRIKVQNDETGRVLGGKSGLTPTNFERTEAELPVSSEPERVTTPVVDQQAVESEPQAAPSSALAQRFEQAGFTQRPPQPAEQPAPTRGVYPEGGPGREGEAVWDIANGLYVDMLRDPSNPPEWIGQQITERVIEMGHPGATAQSMGFQFRKDAEDRLARQDGFASSTEAFGTGFNDGVNGTPGDSQNRSYLNGLSRGRTEAAKRQPDQQQPLDVQETATDAQQAGSIRAEERPDSGTERVDENSLQGDRAIQSLLNKIQDGESAQKAWIDYAAVTDREADRLQERTGVDVHGFRRMIDADTIRHILRKHGPASRDSQKFEVADLLLIPEVVSNPDETIRTDNGPQGLDKVVHKKRIGSDWVVVEEVRKGRRKLAVKTLYRERSPRVPDASEDSRQTFETLPGHDDEILPTKSDPVNRNERAEPAAQQKPAETAVAPEAPAQENTSHEAEPVRSDGGQEPAGEPDAEPVAERQRVPESAGDTGEDAQQSVSRDSESPEGPEGAGPVSEPEGDSVSDGAGSTPDGGDAVRVRPGDGAGEPSERSDGNRERKPRKKRKPRGLTDYVYDPDNPPGQGGLKTKFKANVKAIETLKIIEDEGRLATADEKRVLADFVGFGAMPGAFNQYGDWSKEYEQLRTVLTEEEWTSARQSTINAHFTNPKVVEAMWTAAKRLGFKGGRVLEPSAGIGYFLGMLPKALRPRTRMTAVELDSLTGRMAKALYPESNVQVMGFEDYPSADGFFDLAISNVPFADVHMRDRNYPLRPVLHDYFFQKSIDKVRPGGVVMFITSTGTMDKKDSRIREAMAEKADLVAAFRLPTQTHKGNAGTEVVTDLIILRRKDESNKRGKAWTQSTPMSVDGTKFSVNEYFRKHPEHVIGTTTATGSMYAGKSMNVEHNGDWLGELGAALAKLPRGTFSKVDTNSRINDEAQVQTSRRARKNTIQVQDGKVIRQTNGAWQEVDGGDAKRVAGLVKIRDARDALIDAELSAKATDDDIDGARALLNDVYDSFVKANGHVGRPVNRKALKDDPDLPNILALESPTDDPKRPAKADIFTKRTLRPIKDVDKAESPQDAVAISLERVGRVDLGMVANALSMGEADAAEKLRESGAAFEDTAGGWAPREIYLAGNVREKLAVAEQAAKADADFAPNVAALKEVQPKDVTPSEISVRIGSSWLPASDMSDFADHLSESSKQVLNITYDRKDGRWTVKETPHGRNRYSGSSLWTEGYGTGRAAFPKLLAHALNETRPTFTYEDAEGNRKKDTAATQAAWDKIKEINDAFREWIWSDKERTERLAEKYNQEMNNWVPIKWDGSHITAPGSAEHVYLSPHRVNAVWQTIATGRALYGHEVGTGKTLTMAMAAMELRRLGLARKPCIACLKANVGAVASDIIEAYPSARVLQIEKFDAKSRKETVARIATGDWDVVVLTHDNLDMLPMSPKVEERYVQEELTELEAVIVAAKAEAGQSQEGNRFVKQLAKSREKLKQKIKGLQDTKKDDAITFEETGIDFLFVDEAHHYKSVPIHTKHKRVRGIPAGSESKRAIGMQMRTRWLLEQNNNRGVVFATGTPVTNTLPEVYVMQRFLQPKALEERGLLAFDSWLSVFAEKDMRMEKTAGGTYKSVERLGSFQNLPELRSIASEVTDIQRASKMPWIKRPERDDQAITVEVSDAQGEYLQFLNDWYNRQESSWKAQKSKFLKIAHRARAMAMDMRMVDASLPSDPGSKLNRLADEVIAIWREHPDKTQMIFSDEIRGLDTSGDGHASNDEAEDVHSKFNVFEAIIDRLVAAGIPADKIINFDKIPSSNAKRKTEAAEKLNDGRALIALGSTQKLGTGVNAQRRLIALHHLDVPWKPGDIEQRNGRGIRQDNENKSVLIHQYVTKGTFDEVMWNKVSNKTRFIEQFMDGDVTERTIKEEDAKQISAAEMEAIASGNPLVLERVELEGKVEDLERSKQGFERQLMSIRMGIGDQEAAIEYKQRRLKEVTADAATVAKHKDGFSLELAGETYDDRDQAQEVLADRIGSLPRGRIGSYRGLDIIHSITEEGMHFLSLRGAGTYEVDSVGSMVSRASRLDATKKNISRDIPELEEDLNRRRENAKKAWPRQEEYTNVRKRLKEVMAELAPEESADPEDGKIAKVAEENEDGPLYAPRRKKTKLPSTGDKQIEAAIITAIEHRRKTIKRTKQKIDQKKAGLDDMRGFYEEVLDRYLSVDEQVLATHMRENPQHYLEALGRNIDPVQAFLNRHDAPVRRPRMAIAPLSTEAGWRSPDLRATIATLAKNLKKADKAAPPIRVDKGQLGDHAGSYDPNTTELVVANHNDLDAVAHEIGHWTSIRYGLLDATDDIEIRREIAPFAIHGSKEQNKDRFMEEGIAEWWRAWMVNPTEAVAAAPNFADVVFRNMSPKVIKEIRTYGDAFRRWAGASAVGQIAGGIKQTVDSAREQRQEAGILRRLVRGLRAHYGQGRKARKERSGTVPDNFEASKADRARFSLSDREAPQAANWYLSLMLGDKDPETMSVAEHWDHLRKNMRGNSFRIREMMLKHGLANFDMQFSSFADGSRMTLVNLLGDLMEAGGDNWAELLDRAHAYGVAQRTLSLAQRFTKKAQDDVDAYTDALFNEAAGNLAMMEAASKKIVVYRSKVFEALERKLENLTAAGAGVESAVDVAKRAVEELETDQHRGAIEAYLRKYREWSNWNLDYAVGSEVLSPSQATAIRAANPDYIDWHRVFGEDDGLISIGQEVGGSTRTIHNPLESLLHATWSTVVRGDHNRLMATFTAPLTNKQVDKSAGSMASLGQRISEEEAEKAFKQQEGYHDDLQGNRKRVYRVKRTVPLLDAEGEPLVDENTGEPVWATETHYWVFDAATEASIEAMRELDAKNPMVQVMKALTSLQRMMITTSMPFRFRTIAKDNMSQIMDTEGNALTSLGRVFHKHSGKELEDGYTLDELFALSGAGMAGMTARGREELIGEVFTTVEQMTQKGRPVISPEGLIKRWQNLGERIENHARKREFYLSFKRHRKEGWSVADAARLAAIDSRELLDTAGSGRMVGQINAMALFLNAATQGLRRTTRHLRRAIARYKKGDVTGGNQDAAVVLTRLAIYGATAFILRVIMLAQMDDDELIIELNRPAWKRDFSYLVNTPWETFAIAKPYEWGWAGSGIERWADYLVAKHKGWDDLAARSHEGWVGSFFRAVLPVDWDTMATGFAPIVETVLNRSFFTGRPIVQQWEVNKDLDKRHGQRYASPVGRAIGTVVRSDARRVDHIIRGYGGGWGSMLTSRDLEELFKRTSGSSAHTSPYQDRDVAWVLDRAIGQGIDDEGRFKSLRRDVQRAAKGDDRARAKANRKARRIRRDMEEDMQKD